MTFDLARKNGTAFGLHHKATSAADLRVLSAQEINGSTIWTFEKDPSITAFTPSIDNYVLPTTPAEIFDQGLQMKIPIMAGWNTFEGAPFLPRAIPHANPAEYKADAAVFFTNRIKEFLRCYPENTEA
jgi:para-nitrobenzyl esterase